VTVAELLDEARDFHPSFTRQNHPDPVVMRALSRYVRRMAAKITEIDETALAEPVEVDAATLLAAITGRTGIALDPHLMVLQPIHAVRELDGIRVPVDLVDLATRNQVRVPYPAASLAGGKLYPLNLMDVAGDTYDAHGWEEYTGLELMMVPLPVAFTGPTDTVTLPDACMDAIVHHLALFMAGRGKGALAELPSLPTQVGDAEAMAISAVAGANDASTWRVG
jgi:hypothetical protein